MRIGVILMDVLFLARTAPMKESSYNKEWNDDLKAQHFRFTYKQTTQFEEVLYSIFIRYNEHKHVEARQVIIGNK